MSRGQHVTYHRRDDILSTRPVLKTEFNVERIDPEVAPTLAVIGRRTRTSVANPFQAAGAFLRGSPMNEYGD
jgi:hypothetical protein